MKKVLIGTSALVAAGFIVAGPAAAADKIKLGVGGYMNQWIGFANQDGSYEGTNEYGSFDSKSNTEIHFSGSTKLDNGLTVGAKVELESDRDTGTSTQGRVIDSTYAYVSSDTMGTVYLGGHVGAHDLLTVNAPSAAFDGATTGGQEGPWQWIDKPGAADGQGSYAGGNVAAVYFVHIDAGDTNKVTYVSPSFNGFQIGASYVPSTSADMDVNNYKDNTTGQDEHEWQLGAKYSGNFDGVGLNLSAGYINNDDGEVATATDGYNRWRANGTISYAGFTFGGGYTKYSQDNSSDVFDGNAWNVGLMYATGPYKISANYYASKLRGTVATAGDDKFTYYGLNGAYNMGPGVDLKASISKVKWDDETTAASNNNDGWFAAAGLNLTF